uniref:Uncharacterized protein n=1 Tax=Candidatus Kentrum sp. TUN TaxID=2126343 RepID=A0A451AB40_9GAMM|nr:MAG: hypothetical protein BECKTUN1418D_GA0071000_12044 [Candidatus Kentron sp. TUN]
MYDLDADGCVSVGKLVLPVLAYLVDSAVRSFAPKGLRILAQGCGEAATLGRERTKIQPQRGCVKGAWENNGSSGFSVPGGFGSAFLCALKILCFLSNFVYCGLI